MFERDPFDSCGGIRVLTTAKAIREELALIRPTKIAVAYVGRNWNMYLPDIGLDTEVVLSPTLGSNPHAIQALMGLDEQGVKVHFLDNLHSKIYIGEHAVLAGSCNLSDNALGEGGLHEVAFVSDRPEHRQALLEAFYRYVDLAKKAYPTPDAMQAQLAKLFRLHELANRNRLLQQNRPSGTPPVRTIEDHARRPKHRIHVGWWQDVGNQPSRANVRTVADSVPSTGRYLHDWMYFTPEDALRQGDWILSWRCRADGHPYARSKLRWMQVDYVLPNADRGDYPKAAIDLHPPHASEMPFQLDGLHEIARQLLKSDRFMRLRPRIGEDGEEETWYLPDQATVTDFLTAIAKHAKKAEPAARLRA